MVRPGIIWDGVEPNPGMYNEEYLKGIDEIIGWASDYDIYVFHDMHQDLFSVKFSDGAPAWATIDNGLPHLISDIWSDSYFISPVDQSSFDNFWINAITSSGKGLQEHYLDMWKYLAARYSTNTTVIGYDIMNEPFMGTEANKVMPILLKAYTQILVETTGQVPPSENDLLNMWGKPQERIKALELLSEKEVYRSMIDTIYEVNSAFEKGPLTTFFQKARVAIRKVDRNHIVFIEHNCFANMGVKGSLQHIIAENGEPDSLIAYGAHGYDLVVDTDAIAFGSNDRVELIFERIAETGNRLDVPVLIGEWGALSNDNPALIPVAQFLMNQFNRHLFSDTYWAYGDHMDNAPYFDVLCKPYPYCIAGELIDYGFDYKDGVFSCQWLEDAGVASPSLIYIPDVEKLNLANILLTPPSDNWYIRRLDSSDSGYLEISNTGQGGRRSIKLKL